MRRSSIAVAEKEKKESRLRSDLEIYELEFREGNYPDGPKVVNISRVPRDKRWKSLSDIFSRSCSRNDDNSSVNTCSPFSILDIWRTVNYRAVDGTNEVRKISNFCLTFFVLCYQFHRKEIFKLVSLFSIFVLLQGIKSPCVRFKIFLVRRSTCINVTAMYTYMHVNMHHTYIIAF